MRTLLRSGAALCVAVLVMLALFLLMQAMIAPPEAPPDAERRVAEIQVAPPPEPDRETPPLDLAQAPPPPPPPAPAPARTEVALPLAFPAPSPSPVEVSVPASFSSGRGLSQGSFAGFGAGSGSGSGGYGRGEGFSGKPLVPLSTARPQMPDWACERKIAGWVEVVFVVMPNGRVKNIRIVDASPRGVYEAAAIESVSNWLYAQHPQAREVKQRVPMDPADCAYNYPRG